MSHHKALKKSLSRALVIVRPYDEFGGAPVPWLCEAHTLLASVLAALDSHRILSLNSQGGELI